VYTLKVDILQVSIHDTMEAPHSMYTYKVKNTEVSDLDHQQTVLKPKVCPKETMPISCAYIPTTEEIN